MTKSITQKGSHFIKLVLQRDIEIYGKTQQGFTLKIKCNEARKGAMCSYYFISFKNPDCGTFAHPHTFRTGLRVHCKLWESKSCLSKILLCFGSKHHHLVLSLLSIETLLHIQDPMCAGPAVT